MSRSRLSPGVRATIAIVALYAFVLQAFLAGLQPAMGAPGAVGFSELCAPASDGSPAKHDRKGGCCTAACMPFAVPLPRLDGASITWPIRQASVVVFAERLPAVARGPPLHAHSARGPPQA